MASRLANSPLLSFFTYLYRMGNVTIGKWFIDRDRDFLGKRGTGLFIYYDLVKLFAKWSSKADRNVGYFLRIPYSLALVFRGHL